MKHFNRSKNFFSKGDGTNPDSFNPSIRSEIKFPSKIILILKGNLIVIPAALQEGVLRVAHYHHQGISKTKAMLCENVWWPSLNLDIENTVKACHACQVTATYSLKCQPLHMSEIPKIMLAYYCS